MLWVFAVALAIELPLFAFHLTVLFCVTRCVLKKEHFAQGAFFKVFIMKSLVDYIAYAFGSAFYRALHEGLPFGFMSVELQMAVQFLMCFSQFFLTAADTAISATRYTAIVHPLIHQWIWTGARLTCVLLALTIVPAGLAAVSVVLSHVPLVEDEKLNISIITAVVFTLVNTVLSAFMVFRALQLYLRMTHNRKKTSREDYRLLVFAILNLSALVLLGVSNVLDYFGSIIFSERYDHPIAKFITSNIPNLVSFVAFSGPVFLLLTCRSIRLAYVGMMCGRFMTRSTQIGAEKAFTARSADTELHDSFSSRQP